MKMTERSVKKFEFMPRSEEQFEEIRESKRKLILDTALGLFADYGYHGTSISMLVKEAGISKGLIYNYFKSKEEILKDIFDEGLEQMMSVFDPNKDGVLTTAELEYFINKSFDFVIENRQYWSLYFSVMLQPSVLKMFEKKIQELVEPITRIFYAYFEDLGCPDPMLEMRYFGALMDGLALNYIMDPEHFPVEKVKKRLLDDFTKKKIKED
jgi:AcrR family transcriptional regulator